MSEKKELKEEDISKVSGGWAEDTVDYPEEDKPIATKTFDGNSPEENIKKSNARPNR